MLMYLFALLIGCNENTKIVTLEPDVQDSPIDTGSNKDDTDVPDIVEVDPMEKSKTATTICTAGGYVEGSSISGSFCFGAVDISPTPQVTSPSYTWQPGPYTAVSP